MLRGNLSTRPFYNERGVQVMLAGLALALGLVTVFTAWQFVALSAQQRELSARMARDESKAADLRREAQRVRGRIDAARLASTVKAAREANLVIDERTFSWTALFNVIERTIPPGVRLRSVTPSVDRGILLVRLTVNARSVEPVGQFLDRLEAAGAFVNMQSIEEQLLEDGTYNVVCSGQYLGPGAPSSGEPDATAPAPAASVAPRAGAGAN
jgi:Tfp pilus assembly protein PilN